MNMYISMSCIQEHLALYTGTFSFHFWRCKLTLLIQISLVTIEKSYILTLQIETDIIVELTRRLGNVPLRIKF